MSSSISSKWYSIQELADMFGTSHWCIRRLIGCGKLPAVRIGRSLRISEASVAALLAATEFTPDVGRRASLSRPHRQTRRRALAKGGESA